MTFLEGLGWCFIVYVAVMFCVAVYEVVTAGRVDKWRREWEAIERQRELQRRLRADRDHAVQESKSDGAA